MSVVAAVFFLALVPAIATAAKDLGTAAADLMRRAEESEAGEAA